MARGAKAFTVYNHMLLATEFESLEYDYWHLCEAVQVWDVGVERQVSINCLLYTSPSPRDKRQSRMPSSA